jgi:hypothetical protein
MSSRVPPCFFTRLYAENPDPWGFETSAYEHAKYDATIAARDGRRFARGLVIASEVLYYLDEPAFEATCDAIERTLDGVLLAVHWRPRAPSYPATGDEVHARLRERFGKPELRRVEPKYVLDRFEVRS